MTIVLWILGVMAVVAVFVYFGRAMALRRAHIDWQDFVKGTINLMESGKIDEALSICEDTAVPVASVVASAIVNRSASMGILRDAVDSKIRFETSRLERRMTLLVTIGEIAPAMGLLGTIIGFMNGVMLVNSGEIVMRADLVDVTMNSLVCAITGLAVSIPITVMCASLRNRMNRIFVEIDAAAKQIIGYIATKDAHK